MSGETDATVRLKAHNLSLSQLVEHLAAKGVTTTPATVSRWRAGILKPPEAARAIFAKLPFLIPVEAWDMSPEQPRGKPAPPRASNAIEKQEAKPGLASAKPPDTGKMVGELLARIQRWREAAEADGASPSMQAELTRLELRAIEKVAELTGQGATSELELVRSPYWTRLRGELLAALEPHPAAARAVLDALEGAGAA